VNQCCGFLLQYNPELERDFDGLLDGFAAELLGKWLRRFDEESSTELRKVLHDRLQKELCGYVNEVINTVNFHEQYTEIDHYDPQFHDVEMGWERVREI